MLPPYSLSVRDEGEKIRKELKFPQSPAFVNVYKIKHNTHLTKTSEFCQRKNIPFNSEEHNFYRL